MNEQISGGIRKILDQHGYAFHYSVIRLLEDKFIKQLSPWAFEAAEVPVEVSGHGTRIDFVLSHKNGGGYVVGECKRANPSRANWCFAKAPYVRRDRSYGEILFDQLNVFPTQRIALATNIRAMSSENIYHIALDLRTEQRGGNDGGPSANKAIEEATTQVFRGVNGFIEFLAKSPQLLKGKRPIWIIPVIFTTANLWVTEIDLAEADPATGILQGDVDAKQTSFLWYRYHISPGLKHSVTRGETKSTMGDLLDMEYARTVAIVNAAKGMDEFLNVYFEHFDFL